MASTNRSTRIPHEKWEVHKPDIVRQFVDQDRSLDEIVDYLKKAFQFIVTKNQLSHRLNKVWRIHKKTPKGKAEAVWRYVDHQIAERRRNGKTSNVILDGALLDSVKVTKETGRYSQRAWSSGIAIRPKTPPGHFISVSTPRDIPVRTSWPRNLPWLSSPVQSLKLPSSIWGSSTNKELVSNWKDLTLLRSVSRSVFGYSSNSCNLLVPEAEENEAARRMKIIRSGTAEESLQEQLKLLFFQASNKLLFEYNDTTATRWPSMLKIIQLIDFAGFMRQPLDPGEDFTLLAAREELFQQTFQSMSWICTPPNPHSNEFQGPLLDDDIKTITRFVEWLLLSGQDPDVPVQCCCRRSTSALQSALECRLENLAGILLQHNADAHGRLLDAVLGLPSPCWMHLPPLVLAIVSSSKSNNGTLLSKFEKQKELLEEFLSSTSLQHQEFQDTYGPDKEHLLYEMMDRPNHEEETLFFFQYIKQKLGSAWFQKSEHNQGLLFHAARSGSLDLLNFALENVFNINITNRSGATALHNAVLARHSVYRTCSYLFEHKATLECSTADMSAFHLACSQVDDVEVLGLLYSHGADVYKEIPVTPAATKWMLLGKSERHAISLLMDLEQNSTPLKSVMNNQRIGSYEMAQFCLKVAQSDTKAIQGLIDASLQSANAEILILTLRADDWQALRSNGCIGSLRTTIQCCDGFLEDSRFSRTCCKRLSRVARISIAHELLDAGVAIGPGDAVRAARLEDWDLVRRICKLDPMGIAISSVRSKTGVTISFLEATITWCPRHAFEITQVSPYSPEALCAAARGVCLEELKLDVVEELLKNRSFCDFSTLDTTLEMAALGIALYHDRTQLFRILQKHLPAQSLSCLPDVFVEFITDRISRSFWWHEPDVGSFSSFAISLEHPTFLTTIHQYGWDIICLSLLVQSQEYGKIELLMNFKMLRQDDDSAWDVAKESFPSPLNESIRLGDSKLVQACIQLGECVNGDDPWSKMYNRTPLVEAVTHGYLPIIDLLLEFGADVNRPGIGSEEVEADNTTPQTPLLKACSHGYLAIAKRLIEHGSDISVANDEGWTALGAAAARGAIDMIQLLLSEGGDTVGKNHDILDSAISKATQGGHMAVVRLLKAHAGKLNQEYLDNHEDDVGNEDRREDRDNGEAEITGEDDVGDWDYLITLPE